MPQALGFGGVLPFAAGALVTTVAPGFTLGVQATQLYAASILSFLGGVHWGLALRNPASRDFVVSVVPSLVAWTAAVAAPHNGFPVLSASFAALYVYDMIRLRAPTKAGLIPHWYLPLRAPLTLAAAGCCLVAALSTHRLHNENLPPAPHELTPPPPPPPLDVNTDSASVEHSEITASGSMDDEEAALESELDAPEESAQKDVTETDESSSSDSPTPVSEVRNVQVEKVEQESSKPGESTE